MTEPVCTRALVSTRHGYMHVRSFGVAAGPPLLLLHMGPISGEMFNTFAPLLAQARRVIVPDRIGFGGSDRMPAALRLSDFADATIDALDALGVARFDVLGVHTGSCEAIELATRHRDRVRSVALVALLAFTEEEARDFRDRFSTAPVPVRDGTHLLWHWNRWLKWRAADWELAEMQQCVVETLRAGPESRWGLEAVLAYPTAARVAEIGQPLLVFTPDDYVSAFTQRGLASLPPHARVTVVSLTSPGTTPVAMFSVYAEHTAREWTNFTADI
jgi:pimeloyl-ACP methyl ester carboxylesterase